MKKIKLQQGNFYYAHIKTENVPAEMNSRHCHDKYEILYIVDGKGQCVVEGVEYPVRSRTLMIFPPLTYHCVTIEEGSTYERLVLHFDRNDLQPWGEEILAFFDNDDECGATYYSAEAITDSVTTVFDRFENAISLPDFERTTMVKLLFCELLLVLSVAKKEHISFDEGALGARVIKYLNDHVDKDISLDTLAKRFFVSKYYLCRAFKKHNGISVHGYINQKRVMYAKQLIESGETASGAAYRVGFGDYSAFYRAYVKVVGKSPTSVDSEKEGT